MYRSLFAVAMCILLVGASSSLTLGASPGDVVINEIFPNAATYFDGPEYIELYNTTGDSIDLAGWILNSTEFGDTCKGYRHQFPPGSGVAANGYFVITRDVVNYDTTGYEAYFGKLPDLEMYDASQTSYEINDTRVPNTIVKNPNASYDDQIRLIPGPSDYGKSCGGSYDRYEVIYLYDAPGSANLIDAMEYRYLSCTSDQCSGIGASNNDAFPSYPDEDLSLGRDASGSDSDNSSVDFAWQTPTPGKQNVDNLPPDIWSLEYSPCAPAATDSVTISCYATDPDGVDSLYCFFKQGPAAWDSIAMYPTVGEDSLYRVNLPPRPNGTQCLFYVKATDNAGITGYLPEDEKYGPYRYSVGITAISEIQEVDVGDDRSYYEGLAKNITGVVTVGRGVFLYNSAIFVVQQGYGPWSGIYVFDPTYSVPAATGDSVTLSGLVQEYRRGYETDPLRLTQLYLIAGCYTEHSSGHTVRDTVVACSQLNTASDYAESWEGVLVTTENVTVTNDNLGYGEWEINDGSGSCIVDDDAAYSYYPKNGHVLAKVRGILNYSYDFYKIEPRGDEDIEGAVAIGTVRYTPHAPTTTDIITVSAEVSSDNPIDWVYLYYSTDGGANYDSTEMASDNDTLYAADIGPYPVNLTVVDYYVGAKDSAGFRVQRPDTGSYDLRIGELTIYEIQSNFGTGDASAYQGEPVNVSGIVTAGTGEYSDYNFYIQNSYENDVPPIPEFRGIRVYARTDTLTLSRGDSVTVSGDVWEYYGETEISMFFPEAITIHTTGNPVPEAYSVTTASIHTSEEWEGVLVIAEGAAVKDPDVGFGEWWISNGTLADTCRVGDDAYYTYEPQLDDSVNVRGIVAYAYGNYILQPRDDDDICEPSEAGIGGDTGTAAKLMMSIVPNPISGGGTVRFALPTPGEVALKIYDVQGELVKTLLDGSVAAGAHQIDWNATNSRGNRVTSGIYFFRLETRRGSVINKVVVSR